MIFTVCKAHNFKVLTGPGSLLSEYECPTCVTEQDAEYAASMQPCCSAMNTTCCGHDDE